MFLLSFPAKLKTKSRSLFYKSPDILPVTSILSPKRGEAEITAQVSRRAPLP
jgi:hypothetical protein